jgi:N-hydroxyarylamine O-acetyltransferase
VTSIRESEPSIDRYLDRIGYRGPLTPSLATLERLHRAHLGAIPYENLDIHLGRPMPIGVGPAFRKLVDARRGGWCYEMNGLFGWALGALGFRVRRVAGTVFRPDGSRLEGDHLVLLVDLDRTYLADVGFGDGPLDPLPLAEGTYRVEGFEFRLERRGDRWLFHNHEQGGARGFDFALEPRELEWFGPRCHELQTSPSSGFVQKTVCQQPRAGGIVTLRGAVLTRLGSAGLEQRVVAGAAEYGQVLEREFGLRIPEVESLWGRVHQRHLEWVRSLQSSPNE